MPPKKPDKPSLRERAAKASEPKRQWSDADNGKSRELTSVSHDVQTVEDALAKAEVDTAIWEVERTLINSWEVVGNKIGRQPLWQVKVWLRRRVSKVMEDAAKLLADRMAKHAPKYTAPKRKRVKREHMLEVSPFDLHFGKLAWAMETGEDYDLDIAERVYESAVQDLAAKAQAFDIGKIVLPIGQDFFHIDNLAGETVNGTPQDTDGRYAKMFAAGAMACVRSIDFLRQIAPVQILWVPGNHDRTVSWHLASYLGAWYRRDKAVTADDSPRHRKYIPWGKVLLGFTHGDEEPHRDLPTIMAGEVPELWAASIHREWHLGHFHKRKEVRHVAGDTFGPVHVRILPSLSGTDAWHYRKGFVGGQRAAEAYLWSRDGYEGHFSARVRAAA